MCKDAPPHEHTVLEGRVWSYKVNKEVWMTSEAAEYPTGLCEDWANRWSEWLKQNPPTNKASGESEPKFIKVGPYQNKLVREELQPVPETP